MFDTVFENLALRVTRRSVVVVFAPAILFWLAGLGAWAIGHSNGPKRIRHYVTHLSSSNRLELGVGILLGVAASAFVARLLQPAILHLLEGYGWRRLPGGEQLCKRWERRRTSARAVLLGFNEHPPESMAEWDRWTRAHVDLHRIPTNTDALMPMRLGNILRASELRSSDHYGLDASVCMPRLWLILPDSVRHELASASSDLGASAVACAWGLLLLVWVIWTWYAVPAALLATLAAYRISLGSAIAFGDLIESCFDVYRWRLYEVLRWPLPANPRDERNEGRRLTQFIWSGLTEGELTWTPARPQAELPGSVVAGAGDESAQKSRSS